jgi:hypothetical protein
MAVNSRQYYKSKHVEGSLFPCLDEGSNPSGSTINKKEELSAIIPPFYFKLVLF